ncbi:F-box/FBD/LRR-repeat protein At1g13570-like [Solanum tuberosum]|uniref:F-box/FBD/LRR-repeat protein At1g13570-like n=1 Tax=Solanum tuberosum TaxID=4113 RepID=UPI00073A5331|nr:PREDICTED: F-box/FBD/LRR-repeat protein At1g13570-like [Solanum tuberosum]
MPPKHKKVGRESVSVDIFSNLPSDVTDAILMCLLLRDIVRTSILSKRWRYKWCKLPELTLNLNHLRTNDLIPPTLQFTNIMYHLLTLHVGPIIKFTLSINCFLETCPVIDNLIFFLSRNGIQHLVLQLPSDGKLPSSVFKCLQLRHLIIRSYVIVFPPALEKFDRLVNLELCSVSISSKLLESLISNCSFLQQLVLKLSRLTLTSVVEIKAPMLRSFDFSGSIQYICLKNIPLLAKVSLIDEDCFSAKSTKCDIINFFKSFVVLENLHLSEAGTGGVPARLPFDLKFVKRLRLSSIYLDKQDEILCALCLIKSCPYLEYIDIVQVYDSPALPCLELEGLSDVMFSHLKEVKPEGFLAPVVGMQLIKLLLDKSPVLVRMLIKPYIDDDHHWQLCESLSKTNNLLAAVNAFRRALPKAELKPFSRISILFLPLAGRRTWSSAEYARPVTKCGTAVKAVCVRELVKAAEYFTNQKQGCCLYVW